MSYYELINYLVLIFLITRRISSSIERFISPFLQILFDLVRSCYLIKNLQYQSTIEKNDSMTQNPSKNFGIYLFIYLFIFKKNSFSKKK